MLLGGKNGVGGFNPGLCGMMEVFIFLRISLRRMQFSPQNAMSTRCNTRVIAAMTIQTMSLVEVLLDCPAATWLASFVGKELTSFWVVKGVACEGVVWEFSPQVLEQVGNSCPVSVEIK